MFVAHSILRMCKEYGSGYIAYVLRLSVALVSLKELRDYPVYVSCSASLNFACPTLHCTLLILLTETLVLKSHFASVFSPATVPYKTYHQC